MLYHQINGPGRRKGRENAQIISALTAVATFSSTRQLPIADLKKCLLEIWIE